MTTITRHLRTTVVLESVGNVDVSTIDLSQSTPFWTGYETCLFWRDSSQVVETYDTWQAAVEGHAKWADAPTIARCLTGSVR